MSLRLTAESDLAVILEDDVMGFGWPITLTDPAGTAVNLTGFSNDISQVIDPDTGQLVSGRLASAALRLSSIYAAFPGSGLPRGIADTGSKPWLVTFDDINGNSYNFKISKSNPDRALGILTLILEAYEF